jgi:EamA domain-containing membrane protein RarD
MILSKGIVKGIPLLCNVNKKRYGTFPQRSLILAIFTFPKYYSETKTASLENQRGILQYKPGK